MENILKIWWSKIIAETPVFWQWVRNLCGYVPILLSAVNMATSGMVAPIWFTNNQFYIAGVAAFIIAISQSQTKKNVTEEVKK